jgi:DNA-binding MarR family transcriptional regulator
MVARLTKIGLVTKARGALDGRVVKVELTDKGHELLLKKRQSVRKSYRALFDKLTSAQQERFIESIRYLNGFLNSNIE